MAPAIALAVAVVTSPFQPTPWVGSGRAPDDLRRNFANPTSPPASHGNPTKTVLSARVRLKALASECEPTQLVQGERVTRVSVPAEEPARGPVRLGEPQASHPLRC